MFFPELLEARQLLSVTPVIVADINQTTTEDLETPDAPIFGDVNGVTVFVEHRGDGSSRLVSVKQNFAETRILNEFSRRTDLRGTSFTKLSGILYFRAEDSLNGDELWTTDGTAAGTKRVWTLGQQPKPRDGSSELSEFDQKRIVRSDGNLLYFNVAGPVHGGSRRLWQSDGTENGTAPVADTEIFKIDFSTVTTIGDSIVYAADGFNGAGMELWRTHSDGSTAMVADIWPGPDSSSPHGLRNVSNTLLFAADDGVNGTELWIDTGTTQWMVMDIHPGPAGSFPQILASSGEETYFTADDGVVGRELWWYTMGPQAFLVSDLNPGPASSAITSGAFLTLTDDFGYQTFLFNGTNGASDKALWTTSSQDEPVQLTFNQPNDGGPDYLTSAGDVAYFSHYDMDLGRELWVSDGTPEGTRYVGGLNFGGYDSNPRHLQVVNTRLHFVAETNLSLQTPYVYVLEGGDPRVVAYYTLGTQSSTPGSFYRVGSGVEFETTDTGFPNSGIWHSDSTWPGTQRLIDDPFSQYRLFGSNGTSAFLEFQPGDGLIYSNSGDSDLTLLTSGVPLGFQKLGSLGVFLVQTGNSTLTLWTSDGTMPGSLPIRELNAGNLPLSFVASSASASYVFFLTRDSLGVMTLWKTDGTNAGTISVSLSDIAPDFTYNSGLFASNGLVYFSAEQPHTGPELWKSDGTIAGTVLVSDTIPGPEGFVADKAVAFHGGLIFSGNSTDTGENGLWFTGGTADTTTRLTDDLPQGLVHDPIDNLLVVGDLAYFTRGTDDSGTELWKTDGTALGTSQLKDLLPGSLSSFPRSLTNIDGQLMLTALDGDGVRQIWISDGTADGTIALRSDIYSVAVHPETDFAPTPYGILFTGATQGTGWELYTIPVMIPQVPTISAVPDGSDGVAVEWQSVENSVRYEVWISNLSDPSFIPAQVLTTETSWNVPPALPVGAYRVWVRGYSVLQEPSAWSAPQDFVVGADPVMHTVAPRSLNDRPTFSWTGPFDAQSYEIWLTNRDSKVRTLYASGLKTTSLAVPDELDPAKYAVWVRSTNADGLLSDWSPLTEFEVQASPVVLISGAGEILEAQPTFQWQAVPDATGYDIRVIPAGSTLPLYQINNVQGTMHMVTHGLPSGQYEVYIRAVKGTRPFSAWGPGDHLIVKLPPAALRRTGSIIAGDAGLAWNADAFATSYTLEIRDRLTGQQVLPDQTVTGTIFTPTVPFSAGRYSVRVRSNFDAGQSSRWSPPLEFELFHSPVSITSSSAATADATPVVLWSAAPGAISYEIYVSRAGSSVAAYQRAGISGTSHRIDVPLTAGMNQIWVRGHFTNGSRTLWSPVQNLLIGPAPVITRTAAGFDWSPVNGATHYELWLNYLGPDSPIQKIIYDPLWTTHGFTLPATLPRGTYQLWLRAIRAETGSLYPGMWSTSGPFSL